MVIYPEGVWYGYRTKEDVDEILETHVVKGRRVERLMLLPSDKGAPAKMTRRDAGHKAGASG